jgi:hypothetical protein
MGSHHQTQHEHFAEWFENRLGPRLPVEEAAMLLAADAFDATAESGVLTKERLRCIVEAVCNPRMLVWDGSSNLLGDLSSRFPAAAEAIESLSRHSRAHVRFAALCALDAATPEPTIDRVLKAGFQDKSSRVRWKAAQRANELYRTKLVPDLGKAFAAETNPKTKSSVELSLRMLRDGYWIERESRGEVCITARLHNGIGSMTVSKKELRSRGLESILAELREGP